MLLRDRQKRSVCVEHSVSSGEDSDGSENEENKTAEPYMFEPIASETPLTGEPEDERNERLLDLPWY